MADGIARVRLCVALWLFAGLGCGASDDEGRTHTAFENDAAAMGSAGDGSGGNQAAAGGTNGSSGSGGVVGTSGAGGSAPGGGSGGIGAGGASGSGGSSGSAGSSDSGAMQTCLDELGALGVSYVETEARGVVDAVELTAPLNGVLIADGTTTDLASDPMACEFVRTLWEFMDLLKAYGYDRIGTLGSYCYRCCCAWSETNYCRGPDDPEPDCSVDGYSNHSWGRAIDVRYLHKADGTLHDVNDPTHWVQWMTTAGDTCIEALPAQTGISRELYELVCEASARGIFSTILTPNYNAVHRNHFHMDIGESSPASSVFVRSLGLPDVDRAEHGDE